MKKMEKTPKAAGGGRGRHKALTGDLPHYPRDRAASQCVRLGRYLTDHKDITVAEGRSRLRIMAVPARIMDLRDKGWPIATTWITFVDRAGASHRIGKYVLTATEWEDRA